MKDMSSFVHRGYDKLLFQDRFDSRFPTRSYPGFLPETLSDYPSVHSSCSLTHSWFLYFIGIIKSKSSKHKFIFIIKFWPYKWNPWLQNSQFSLCNTPRRLSWQNNKATEHFIEGCVNLNFPDDYSIDISLFSSRYWYWLWRYPTLHLTWWLPQQVSRILLTLRNPLKHEFNVTYLKVLFQPHIKTVSIKPIRPKYFNVV
jgi:hypothetical protein